MLFWNLVLSAYFYYCRLLAIPVTHCSPERSEYEKQCYGGSVRDEIECRQFPEDSGPFDFNFRNQLYFGQFRFICELHIVQPSLSLFLIVFISLPPNLPPFFSLSPSSSVDAVFAVYEATSLELWSFFSYTASDGAPSPVAVAALFYLSMVLFLVIFVQVCWATTHHKCFLLLCLLSVEAFVSYTAKYISGRYHRVVCRSEECKGHRNSTETQRQAAHSKDEIGRPAGLVACLYGPIMI